MYGYHHSRGGDFGGWVIIGFAIALGFLLFKLLFVLLAFICGICWGAFNDLLDRCSPKTQDEIITVVSTIFVIGCALAALLLLALLLG